MRDDREGGDKEKGDEEKGDEQSDRMAKKV